MIARSDLLTRRVNFDGSRANGRPRVRAGLKPVYYAGLGTQTSFPVKSRKTGATTPPIAGNAPPPALPPMWRFVESNRRPRLGRRRRARGLGRVLRRIVARRNKLGLDPGQSVRSLRARPCADSGSAQGTPAG